MDIFFTADLHFDHDAIRRHCNRPFSTVDEMNENMIQNWNSVVPKQKSLVFVIGDFAWKRHLHFLMSLNGKKILIKGNHDKASQEVYNNFTEVHNLVTKVINKKKINMCHYCMSVWPCSNYNSIHLYGHSHGRIPEYEDSYKMDVGVDVWNFFPVSFEVMEYKMSLKKKKVFRNRDELDGNVRILRERNLKYTEELKQLKK